MRVMLNDRRVDLIEEDVDLALRVGHLVDSSLIAVRIGHFRRLLCASPSYVKSRGEPPSDLSSHECVVMIGRSYRGLADPTGNSARKNA